MDLYGLKRFFSHWAVWTGIGVICVLLIRALVWPRNPVGSIPNVENRQLQSRNTASVIVNPRGSEVQPPSINLPAFTMISALTMPVELDLSPKEQASFRLVEWLPLTSTLQLQNDSAQATAIISAFNTLRTDKHMQPLILDEDLLQRAGAMAQSRLAFRLYNEDSTVFRTHQAVWLASFGITEGGPLSVDMIPLPADIIAARHNVDQLISLLQDGAYGPLSSARYSRIGIGVGRVDGWDTGGTLVVLFY